jgi:hypothetical protein
MTNIKARIRSEAMTYGPHLRVGRRGAKVGFVWLLVLATSVAHGQSTANPCPGVEKINASQAWFAAEVWTKVASVECLKCHKNGGDAEDTRLVLQDPTGRPQDQFQKMMRQNFLTLTELAQDSTDGKSRLLSKVTGGLDHGGGGVIKPDSTAFRILEDFVERTLKPEVLAEVSPLVEATPFFDGVTMVDDVQLLRRAALSLAGRLPTPAESQRVRERGQDAIREILDEVLAEEAFYERLREAFNDIFLTLGVDGNPDQTVLSYEHFEKTRGWYQHHDLSHIEDEKERRQAGYKLANDYRKALLDEPMRLVEYIVRNDRPFTEILTADYIMVSPYSARGYGVYETLQDQFENPEDPFEYVPVKLKALVGRSRNEDQESSTGFYPHAGLLSTFQYLSRYPTTETNRNRLRSRMYYQHFLGVDVLELAARGSDAAAVTAQYEIPTMQASECVVCHKTLDPIAGLFQDYWRFDNNFSIYGRRKEGWFTDMFAAGFEGEPLPPEERWRALQWLGERTVEDPRFARTMAGHAYFLLTGRRPDLRPKDLDDPLYVFRERAWRAQQCQIDAMAQEFANTGFNFKQLIKDWVLSDFYRVKGLETQIDFPGRQVELNEIGVVRLLSPEQLERKIKAIFGQPWGQLNGQTAMLYGGIDSKEVTERAIDPSGAMGAIQRTMSNDVACKNVALDFSRPPERRVLFPAIEPDVIPRSSPESDEQIRAAIVHLHQHILGRADASDSSEVQRTFELFADVVQEAKSRGRIEPQETWSCRQGLESTVIDPHYTVRGWRAVVTYLLRQPEFLYE